MNVAYPRAFTCANNKRIHVPPTHFATTNNDARITRARIGIGESTDFSALQHIVIAARIEQRSGGHVPHAGRFSQTAAGRSLTFPNPMPGRDVTARDRARRNREMRGVAHLSLAAARADPLRGPLYKRLHLHVRRRRAHRCRHIIVFEVTAIGTCEHVAREENVDREGAVDSKRARIQRDCSLSSPRKVGGREGNRENARTKVIMNKRISEFAIRRRAKGSHYPLFPAAAESHRGLISALHTYIWYKYAMGKALNRLFPPYNSTFSYDN